jgi:hypothetical protein
MAEHIWDVWEFEGPTTCDQVRFCRHCGTRERKEASETDHEWSDWTPVGAEPPTEEERACQRCHRRETRLLA